MDQELFASPYGITTLARNERMFDLSATNNPSNWLGPVWIVANYVVFKGLLRYGYRKEAESVYKGTLELLGRDLRQSGQLHEYYDPDTGEEKVQEITQKVKVFEKLFLELQADEIELSTAEFKEIYTFFIDKYQKGLEDISTIINELPVSMASIIATFQAQEEEIRLHNWSKKGVEVKPKEADLSYAINGIILNLRKMLIDRKIEELRLEIAQLESQDGDPSWAIQEVMEYNVLKNTISRRLDSN